MHYKNGREARNGDKVMLIPTWGPPVIGILYDAQAGNDGCNGYLAPASADDRMANLRECLHLDDALDAIASGPMRQEPPLGAVLDRIRGALDQAIAAGKSPREFQRDLIGLYADLDPAAQARALRLAFAAAELAGMADIAESP